LYYIYILQQNIPKTTKKSPKLVMAQLRHFEIWKGAPVHEWDIMWTQITSYGLLGVRKVRPRLPAGTRSHW